MAADVVEAVAKDNSFHPVRDYLSGLEWDGTEAHRELCVMLSRRRRHAISPRRQPRHVHFRRRSNHATGMQSGHVPVLEGPQGKGKSTAIQFLFEPWFSDEIAELGTKDAAMQIRSAWCIELGELSSMTRGDIEKVKAFITRKVDRFRPSYGRRVIEVPRQTILVGSTNLDTYLKDETGGRRYWPILCEGELKLADIKRDKDQLWAEAYVGIQSRNTVVATCDVAAEAEEEQAKRYVGDAWHESISRFVRTEPNVSIGDVLMSLAIEKSRWDTSRAEPGCPMPKDDGMGALSGAQTTPRMALSAGWHHWRGHWHRLRMTGATEIADLHRCHHCHHCHQYIGDTLRKRFQKFLAPLCQW